jgi:hypothetical protein
MLKEDTLVPGMKVKWKGTFDFERLYNKIRDWLIVEGFSSPIESLYVERVKPDGKQIEIVWDSNKIEEDYFKYKINILYRATRLEDVETTIEGKKAKLQKATIEIVFKATLEHDAKGKWKDRPKWGEWYEKHFMRENVEKNKIEIYDKTLNLIDVVKDFLSLYSF